MNGDNPLPNLKEREIFCEALKFTTPEDIKAYLNRVCAGDHNLRDSVEALVKNHKKEDMLEHALEICGEKIGDTIDRYKLLEKIGEGGFGAVYRAEQQGPLHLQVALKVIKPGMDTQQVLRRFEIERKALAELEHLSISTVFDAGSTQAGRPYFVMGLVRGTKITDYADCNLLTIQERLKLFVKVCHGVQHAHERGIIHRDITPSNILVAKQSDEHWPKIIDFGIAKVTNGSEAVTHTFKTRAGQLMGTPAYMSPEQVGYKGLEIDNRTDVYSLGVLLYELLVGCLPLDLNRLEHYELLRTIIERTIEKPSAKYNGEAESNKIRLAKCRQTQQSMISYMLRGDLDRIVMKCLEKNRERRYEKVSSLTADIQYYLKNNVVDESEGIDVANVLQTQRVRDQQASKTSGSTIGGWQAPPKVVKQFARENVWDSPFSSKEAISSVLDQHKQLFDKMDLNLGLNINQSESSLANTCLIISECIAQMRRIPVSYCPSDFSKTWFDYIESLTFYTKIMAQHSKINIHFPSEVLSKWRNELTAAHASYRDCQNKLNTFLASKKPPILGSTQVRIY
jgi:serine/threonine protein kinase